MQKFVWLLPLAAICFWLATADLIPVVPDVADVSAVADFNFHDPEQAIAELSKTIDRQAAEPQSAARLAQSYLLRGSFYLQKFEPHAALRDFDEALRLNPGQLAACYGRAECFRQLGDPGRADAEMHEAGTLDLSDAFPGSKTFISRADDLVAFLSSSRGCWLLVAVVWALAAAVNAAIGWGQTVEASGSVKRLACVAALLALLTVLPLGVWAALVTFDFAARGQLWLSAGAALLNLVANISTLQPPVRLRGTARQWPRIDDQKFLDRVAELARSMGVPVPLVRLWPSITPLQQALAFAGTLQAPQLVVTDGILQRLTAEERDAVVAHELGHIANGSLWLNSAVMPVSCTAASAVSAFYPLAIAVPFGVALCVGLRRLVSRPLEIDADRRAARAIGFRETAAALTKIHAVHSLSNSGLLHCLVYATATHPSRDVRLWALRTAAGAADFPELPLSVATIRRHRIGAAFALAVWLLVLAGTLAVAAGSPPMSILAFPLWVAGLTPRALMGMAQWRLVRVERRRLGQRWPQTALFVLAVAACAVLVYDPEAVALMMAPVDWLQDSQLILAYPLCLAGVWLLGGCWYKRYQEIQKWRHEMAVAIQVHDFRRVLEIGKSTSRTAARDPLLRYNIAFAHAVCGDEPAAIARFEQLWRDRPDFPIAAITLTALFLDADQPERAAETARSVAGRLPDDALTHILAARSLRCLGRLDEAQESCEQALSLERDSGAAHAVAAAIALDKGYLSDAQRLIETAVELAPGEPYILIIRAQIALFSHSLEDSQAAVQDAIAAVESNPLAFYRADVARLKRALCALEGPTPLTPNQDDCI